MGLAVSKAEIKKEIEGMPQFQNNGVFDMEKYNAVLAANKLSPTKFENSMRYDLLSSKTVNSISDFVIDTNDHEIEELYNMEKETIEVEYVTISPEAYLETIEVADDELEEWYKTAGENYKTEPMLKLTYLPYLYTEIGTKVSIEEADITNYYDNNLSSYQTPEKRHARHILFKAGPEDDDSVHAQKKEKAEEILARAKQGDDFAGLAEEFSEGPTAASGGDLGFFTRNRMVKPFEEAVFSMESGEISEIVKTDFGYHIIKLEEIQLAGTKSIDQVRDEIVAALKMEQAKPLAFQLANRDYEKIIAAGSVSAFLDNSPQTKKVETDFFSQSAPPAGITSDQTFLERAFQLKKGELSSIIETKDGYAILFASDIKAPEVPELESVKAEAVSDFKDRKAEEKAKSAAEKLLSDLAADSSFEQLAQDLSIEIKSSGKLTKSGNSAQSGFPQSLLQAAFKLSASAPLPETPGQEGSNYYVYRFVKRSPPEEALSEEDRSRYKAMLMQFKQQQILNAWIKNRQAEAKVYLSKSLENY
jgi:peptidyl-prolyl cis-trans isomerase D